MRNGQSRVMGGVDLCTVKKYWGIGIVPPRCAIAISLRIFPEAMNRANLIGTGRQTGRGPSEDNQRRLKESTELVDFEREERWLGEKDSNPHSQAK